MANMVTYVYAKFNYDRLHVDKVLANWESDNNKDKDKENKKNVCSFWGPFPGPKTINRQIILCWLQ